MPSIATRLADGVGAALANLPLALVPLALALTDVQKIRAVLAFSGFRTGVRFTLPASVLTVWGFVSTPATGVSVNAGVPTTGLTDPATVAAAAGGLLVTAVLSAGYFGSVADALAGRRYRFVEHVRRHFRAFLVVTVAPVAVFAPAALLVAAAPASAPVVLLPCSSSPSARRTCCSRRRT
ncbi:hypothetical protein [Halobaculum litoreum]|uniref:Uncharacterized protein n=1 Tax=Halobaculum litoreum TaxID=3031998 RepID=A0ABD5XMG9_9EURY|nr:hypothetical protein [Halobaculum sp. DT92]